MIAATSSHSDNGHDNNVDAASFSLLPKMYSTVEEVENDRRRQHKHFPLSEPLSSCTAANAVTTSHNESIATNDAIQHLTGRLPHLFLHFDVNETILIGDPAGGDTVTECLNKIIAKSAFVSMAVPEVDAKHHDHGRGENSTGGDSIGNQAINGGAGIQRTPSSGNMDSSSTHHFKPTHWWNGQPLAISSLDHNPARSPPPLYTGWDWPPRTCPYYRTAYKPLAKKFTETEHGIVYRPLYQELCAKLGLDQHECEDDTIRNEKEENDVFANFVPAFCHALQHYFPSKSSFSNTTPTQVHCDNDNDDRYLPPPTKVTLVLRTFGTDLPRVAKCISEFARGNHPSYPEYFNPDLILDDDSLFCSSWTYRDRNGNPVNKDYDGEKELIYELHSTTKQDVGDHSRNRQSTGDYCGDDQVLDYLQTKTIVGIQDCYPFWRDQNHAPWAGKPVWAKTDTNSVSSRHNHHHILLDDNIHNDPKDGAGGIRVPMDIQGVDGVAKHTSYDSLHGKEALDMQGKHLIRVPTVRPLLEDDYFIRQIEAARWKLFNDDLRSDKLLETNLVNDELVLSDKNLSDEDFHHSMEWPSTLRSIDLSRNSLKNIPKQIFSLTTLTCLDVSRNSLQGLPPEIKHLHNLVQLIALSNHLRLRQLPLDDLSSLQHLRLLDLRYNRKLKQSALVTLKEVLLPKNLQLDILCTIPLQERCSQTKFSACDRDATLLQSQLEPLSTPQLCKRLERTFGISLDKESDHAHNRDFIMKTLLECYENHGPREVRKELGIPVSTKRQAALLAELEAINWPRTTRERPKIRAEYYMILQKPGSGKADSVRTKKESAKLMRYTRLFDLAVDTLAEVDPEFADRFTALAVTKNFVGSPHIDTLNVGPFYGMSLGEFSGGGTIAVECSPLLVAEIETKGRLGKVDGRFPHWVTPYFGNRYSLIYYVTSGIVEPQTTAIFPPTSGVHNNWIPPPTFVP